MPAIIRVSGKQTIIKLGESTSAASRSALVAQLAAVAAALSAATAESAAGPTYPDTAAGLAATSDGEAFAVDNGDGTVTVWLNDGGVAVEQRTLLTTDYAASTAGAGAIGAAEGGTVQDALDSAQDALDGLDIKTGIELTGNMVDRLRAIVDTNGNYLIRRTATDIAVGASQRPGYGAEFGMRIDDDGLLIMRGAWAADTVPAGVPVEATDLTGTFATSETNPTGNYATSVGATFDLDFTGTGLIFYSFTDNRGGLWNFSIDGGPDIPISVWSETVSGGAVAHTIATGLTDGPHTCTATYAGADPEHPPASGGVNGRGWLVRGVVDGYSTGLAIIDGPDSVRYLGGRDAVIAVSSISEFAMSVRPASETGMAGKWVPAHGVADAGATRGITRSILVNGEDIGSDISVIEEYPVAIRSLVVLQTYTAFCATDVAGDFPLWEGYLAHRYADGVMTVTHTMRLLRDTYCSAGYLAMFPTDPRYVDEMIAANGLELPVAAVARVTDFTSPSLSAAFRKSATGNAVACDVSGDPLGLQAKAFASTEQFFQERTDNVAKVYWRRFSAETIPASEVIRTQSRYFIASNNPMVEVI